jgi:hypothetical protein
MFRLSRLLILTGLLLAAVMPSVAHGKAAIGISDNKPTMFGDNDFKALGTKNVRIVVGWDVALSKKAKGKAEMARITQYMAAAKAGNYKVLVAFDASKDKTKVPKAGSGKLGKALKALRKKFPGQIKQVSPWNEGNLNKSPKQVYLWSKEVKKNCKGCKIVIDVLDKPNLQKWTKKYMKLQKPKIWGLHNYVDVNNFTDRRTKAFLKTTKKGDVWLTETGGVVDRINGGSSFAGSGVDFAARATTYLFNNIVKKQKRIKKVYIYDWNTEQTVASGYGSWDSGLKGPAGELRPAYYVVKANK